MRILLLAALVLCSIHSESLGNCPPEGVGDGVYYCCNGNDGWPTDRDIPVYLNENITTLCTGASTCATFDDVKYQVMSSLNELYSSTGTKLRFYYADSTTVSAAGGEASKIFGALHVYASEANCLGVLAEAAADGDYEVGGDWQGWGKIRICKTISSEPIAWAAAHRGGIYRSFRAVFLHELGHVLGMAHNDLDNGGCMQVPGTAGLMKGSMSEAPADNISVPYVEFVRDMYDQRSNFGHSYWSTIGSTWYTSANAPSQANYAATRYAASNSRSSSYLFVGWRHNDHRIGYSRFNGSSWSFLGFLPHFGWSHIGIASISNSSFMASFQVHWERLIGAMDVKTRATTNGGLSWFWPQLQSDSDTKTTAPGVTSTYDPASQQYITMWRKQEVEFGSTPGDENVISYRVAGSSSPRKLVGARALDTPSIACGPVSVVGSNNCLLAYVSSEDWRGPVKFHHCRVSGANLVCGPEYTHNYLSFGSPSVAYSGTSYPWSIAISQGGSSIYSWRSASANPAQWIDQRSVQFSPQAILPAVGSRSASQDRRYIYSLDD